MKRFSADLQLPFETDMQALVIAARTPTTLMHYPFSIDNMDPRVLEFLSDFGLTFSHMEVFHTPPLSTLPIHIDGPRQSNLVKLNWCFGAPGSKMLWWKLKQGTVMKEGVTPVDTRYLFAEQRDCVMIEAARIGTPTLVNVGVPHSILNQTGEPRWVLSGVLNNGATDVQWDEAVSRLAEVLV